MGRQGDSRPNRMQDNPFFFLLTLSEVAAERMFCRHFGGETHSCVTQQQSMRSYRKGVGASPTRSR